MSTDIVAVPGRIDLVYAESGDWIALYLNGQRVWEGHSLDPSELLERLDLPHNATRAETDESGHFPADLADVGKPPGPVMVERDWCVYCAGDPIGQRWLCSKRPHPMIERKS